MNKKIPTSIVAVVIGIILVAIAGYFVVERSRKTNETVQPPINVASPQNSPSDIQTGAKYVEGLEVIQESTAKGENLDYLDPVGAARAEGIKYGFAENDTFTLEQKNYSPTEDTYLAVVKSTHKGVDYEIILLQPVKVGDGGIWTIASIEKK